jgi:uncharacterized membrane protein YeiH
MEFLAVISAGLFGILLARSKRMDVIGLVSVSLIVAFGGGTLRDVLLDRSPLFWIANPLYAGIVFGLAVIASLLPSLPDRLERWLYVPDALGLGLFSIVGAGIALEQTGSLFLASLFGVITGTFGGVMGEVVANELPSLFRPTTPLYATASFAGCWVFLLGLSAGLERTAMLWIGVAAVVVLRLAALRWDWTLPAPRGQA